MDSAFPSISAAGGSGSGTCKVLDKLQLISFAIFDAVQPVDPLLQLPQLGAWGTPSTHVLQMRSTPKLDAW